jgi:heterodisulfide reductase subunit A
MQAALDIANSGYEVILVEKEPSIGGHIAQLSETFPTGCGACVEICPYEARELDPVRGIATVNAALCQNCGACLVACRNKASRIHNWRPEQILAMADAVLG